LEIVRDMVNETRYLSRRLSDVTSEEGFRKTVNGYTSIDLHGATLTEATQIVQEILYDTPPTNGEKPPFPLPHNTELIRLICSQTPEDNHRTRETLRKWSWCSQARA
jgi:hypothetical protein